MNDLAKLDLVELLDRRADIHTPEPVSYWPQTAGWLVIGFALVAIAALIGWRWFKLRRGNLYRRQALRELDAIAAGPSDAVVQLAAADAGPPAPIGGTASGYGIEALARDAYGRNLESPTLSGREQREIAAALPALRGSQISGRKQRRELPALPAMNL